MQYMSRAIPWGVVRCHGMIFPSSKPVSEQDDIANVEILYPNSSTDLLQKTKMYMMYDVPSHNLAGLLNAGVDIPETLLHQWLRDVLCVLCAIHEHRYVYRNLAVERGPWTRCKG